MPQPKFRLYEFQLGQGQPAAVVADNVCTGIARHTVTGADGLFSKGNLLSCGYIRNSGASKVVLNPEVTCYGALKYISSSLTIGCRGTKTAPVVIMAVSAVIK
jgi:hypothetical protein